MKYDKLEVAIIESFRKVTKEKHSFWTIDIETPWIFTPPGLYPTVHVVAEKKSDDDEVKISIYQSI